MHNVRQEYGALVLLGVSALLLGVGLGGCKSLQSDRDESPTGPAGSVVELGNYLQQTGQSRTVSVNGEMHQFNGAISGNVVGGLYIEINEQSSVGSLAGTDQVAVNLQDVKITFTGLPSGVSAIAVRSDSTELGQYAVSDGSVEIALNRSQWTQWFGPSHYAVVCEAVGSGTLSESMIAVSGRLPSGEVLTFGIGAGASNGGTSCPACSACPAGTYNPNALPTFVDNGNGTVTDTRTGLIWLQNTECSLPQNWEAAVTWTAGLANGSCGLSDGSTAGQWRLPTVKEFQSLLDYNQIGIPLPAGHPFVTTGPWIFWTSDEVVMNPATAWAVTLALGDNRVIDKTTAGLFAWAVR